MSDTFLKPYDSKSTELKIYNIWLESGLFNPDICLKSGFTTVDSHVFSIVLPPPNVTGALHMGHAFESSLQDIAVRFYRMMGYRTLWIPGTDHAAIATQTKVEKILEKEGIKKDALGREVFLERVKKFARESHDIIVTQIKALGASLDWSREAFTLDDLRQRAVREAFKRLFDLGLITRGERIVNWDVKGQTVVSDDEVVYEEETTKFYYLKYGPFIIGTARPETKFGDKYVVMHPNDKRYEKYQHGQKINVSWINGIIEATIIKDESVDMKFGTGVMTITPAHSVVDFDLAEKHNLDKEQIIDLKGRLLPIAGEFTGMKISEARQKIVQKLRLNSLVEKEEDYTHNISKAERSGGIIEPQILKQWFVNVNKKFPVEKSSIIGVSDEATLKEVLTKAVENKQITIIPDHFKKTYFHWINNLRDWCISRQIWYGHRIPVWYKNNEIYCGIEAPKEAGWQQDEDTLDTWFSSGLWTFSTLGWPEKTPDLKAYHPTAFMCPGYEILFFWVARMILMSGALLGDIPFKTVYLHGIVRDKDGKKFSKSAGSGVDPLDVVAQYGADALRMALVIGVGPGNDSKFEINKVKSYKHFANKIWNASRFVIENTSDFEDSDSVEYTDTDTKYLEKFENLKEEVTDDMMNFRFHLAGEKLYHYFWHTFADVIIEESKTKIKNGSIEKVSAQKTLNTILDESLRMLHPFMPFITEEIWSTFKKDKGRPLLLVEKWPHQ